MQECSPLGAKLRALRRRAAMTQAQLAARLGISASYLNLIEQDKRPVSAPILIKLGEILPLDLKSLSAENDTRVAADLLEAFSDPLFEGAEMVATEVRELAVRAPSAARAVLTLYQSYRAARESADTLLLRLNEGDELAGHEPSRLPSEEVTDLVQHHLNHFPDLEAGATEMWRSGALAGDLYEAMVRWLADSHGVSVHIGTVGAMGEVLRWYDPESRRLLLSESLRRGSRNFQLAYQIGLLTQRAIVDGIARDARLTSDESRSLCRAVLGNYFAGALLMPYDRFLDAARTERYDIEVLGNRFRTSFEQVCHRLTTLRRSGAEGVPFHMVRIDVAGNISKRFSASGLRFPRFSGACPRWNVFAAFLTPGMFRTQIAQMPDGTTYFWVARTLSRGTGGYHAPHTVFAMGLGCEIRYARELVYADGVDLGNREAVVPVGMTCRLCERTDCEQRAFPAVQHPMKIDENVRGASFYAPVERPLDV